jgi:glycine dehydrogenase subunit 2
VHERAAELEADREEVFGGQREEPRALEAARPTPELRREVPAELPEVSEPDVVRHYVRLSHHNYCVDTGMFPLGSCTMKYNPKVNEWAARIPGFAHRHPYAPESMLQGTIELMVNLERMLSEVAGLDAVSLHTPCISWPVLKR